MISVTSVMSNKYHKDISRTDIENIYLQETNTRQNDEFYKYISNNFTNTELYNADTNTVSMKLQKIGIINNLYTQAFTRVIYIYNPNNINPSNIMLHRQYLWNLYDNKIIILIEKINKLMKKYNIGFDFINYKYELYEVYCSNSNASNASNPSNASNASNASNPSNASNATNELTNNINIIYLGLVQPSNTNSFAIDCIPNMYIIKMKKKIMTTTAMYIKNKKILFFHNDNLFTYTDS